MMETIDYYLNGITMYRLVLYYLIGLLCIAVLLGFFGILSYSPIAIVITASVLIIISWITNKLFSYVFEAPTNVESVYITALILALIITPIHSSADLIFLGWAAVWACASKFIFAIGKKHIFNPAAIALVITAFGIGQSATWWVGTVWMMPFVVAGGLLIVRKIQREDMILCFFVTAAIVCIVTTILRGGDWLGTLSKLLLHSSYFFFAFVMLTEPSTTPPTVSLQAAYAALIGFLFAPQVHLAGIYSTPELALVTGNVFSYLVSPKKKLMLTLSEKIQITPNMFDFLFIPPQKLSFSPGQYMEWTLPHKHPDSRGNRRYFTIASSPTERMLRLGIRFYGNGSSFKKNMALMDRETIVASQLSGNFTLPKNNSQKCVFIAGGIGITPFRSMIKYLLDTGQKRDIMLFYANKTSDEIMYRDVFDQAQKKQGIKVFYILTDTSCIPLNWQGKRGRINEEMIRTEVPDFKERLFYLSGPRGMVTEFEKILLQIGIKKPRIKKDFFPGFV